MAPKTKTKTKINKVVPVTLMARELDWQPGNMTRYQLLAVYDAFRGAWVVNLRNFNDCFVTYLSPLPDLARQISVRSDGSKLGPVDVKAIETGLRVLFAGE